MRCWNPGLSKTSLTTATILVMASILAGSFASITRAQSGGWTVLPDAPVAGRHDDVQFVTPDVGWICSSSGRIHKTTDGGATWTQQILVMDYFRSIYFSDDQNGWAGTLGNTADVLWNTTDGGTTWAPIANPPTPAPEAVCGLSGFGSELIVGTGAYFGPARFTRSTDGGDTWTTTDMSAYARNLVDCHFWSPDSGLAVGGTPAPDAESAFTVILFTADGGDTWEVRHTGTVAGSYGWKIFFQNSMNGWVSTYSFLSAEVYKTTDGGLTWEEQVVPGTDSLEGIGFVTANRGWVDGWDLTAQTFDGGETWEIVDLGDNNINRFFFLPNGSGYASGSTIYKYDPALSNAPPLPPEPDLTEAVRNDPLALRSYPNPAPGDLTIEFALPQPGQVTVRLYTALGRQFRTLVDGEAMSAGRQRVHWDGRDAEGKALPSGRYLYRVDAAGTASSRILAIVR